MKIYLLGAVGVVFLSVIVSLLVPEGKLNKTITFIMRMVCILVLLQPLAGIFKFSDAGAKDNTDYAAVSKIYSNHQSVQMEKLLSEKFDLFTECDLAVDYVDGEFKVVQTTVKVFEQDEKIIEQIYAYLRESGYINITVYAEST